MFLQEQNLISFKIKEKTLIEYNNDTMSSLCRIRKKCRISAQCMNHELTKVKCLILNKQIFSEPHQLVFENFNQISAISLK